MLAGGWANAGAYSRESTLQSQYLSAGGQIFSVCDSELDNSQKDTLIAPAEYLPAPVKASILANKQRFPFPICPEMSSVHDHERRDFVQ